MESPLSLSSHKTSIEDWHISVIEDSEVDRQIFRRFFKKLNIMSYKFYKTGSDALTSLEAIEKASCILLDLSLPDVDGLELLNRFIQMKNAPPVLILTGCTDEIAAVGCMKSGAKDYIVKDNLTKEGLYRAIFNSVQRYEIEKKLRSRNEEAQNFASIVAHDLRSPLRIIRLASETLEKEISSHSSNSDVIERELQYIRKSSKTMREILDSLLSYVSHGRSHDTFEVVDLNEVVQTAMSHLSTNPSYGKIKFTTEGLPEIYGDKCSLILLFQNIFDNSLKYNDKEECEISISTQEEAQQWVVACSDNGPGVHGDYIEKIFEPMKRFHQQDQVEGVGLGLSHVKKIVEQHGGQINVASTLGKGTSFNCRFQK